MKILHTSDLHLGKSLLEESLFEEQKDMLEQIINIIKNKKIDALIIPGDIYDKSIPSADAVNLFNDFLVDLSKLDIKVFMTSGNHDSKDRLSFGSLLFDKLNIHIQTEYDGRIKKYSTNDVDFYLLPFVKPYHLKKLMSDDEYEKINSANEMMKWILSRETLDKSKKNILLLHQFVMNSGEMVVFSDSESMTNVGTLDAVDVNILDDFDYVALGHIHRPQKVKRDTVRYSGTPLKYSFSEANDHKGVVIIDTSSMELEFVPIVPLRDLKVIRGEFADIMSMSGSLDIVRVELEDTDTIISPMEEIRKRFPNAISLGFVGKDNNSSDMIMGSDSNTQNKTPLELFSNFFESLNERELSDREREYLENLINNLEGDE